VRLCCGRHDPRARRVLTTGCLLREQVKELLLPYGHLKAFNLVMDKSTGNSKVCSLLDAAARPRICLQRDPQPATVCFIASRVEHVYDFVLRQRVQGYAFCEYSDMGATDFVVQSLNGKPVGNKFLTVKRALGPPIGPFETQLRPSDARLLDGQRLDRTMALG